MSPDDTVPAPAACSNAQKRSAGDRHDQTQVDEVRALMCEHFDEIQAPNGAPQAAPSGRSLA
jgi:hypothetical protein